MMRSRRPLPARPNRRAGHSPDRAHPAAGISLWSSTTIRGILHGRSAVGELAFGRRKFKLDRQTGRRVPQKQIDESAIHRIQDDDLRIISADDWARAQALIEFRANARGTTGEARTRRIYPFSGLASCPRCGASCYAATVRKKGGTRVHYTCGTRAKHGLDQCAFRRVPQEELMNWVYRSLNPLLADDDETIDAVLARYRELTRAGRQNARDLKRDVADAEARMARLAARVADPALDDLPDARQALYEQNRDAAQAKVGQALDTAHDDTDELADAVRARLGRLRESLATADPAALKSMIERVVGPITFREEGDELVVKKNPNRDESRKGVVAGTRSAPVAYTPDKLIYEQFWAINGASAA